VNVQCDWLGEAAIAIGYKLSALPSPSSYLPVVHCRFMLFISIFE
jgi:hypothetical protein